MAEEPQPSTVKEGASEPHAPTASAEDRKAAAALSSLDAQDDEGAGKKEVDSKALDSAMKNLSVDGKEVKKVEKKAAVKIDPESVKELVHSGGDAQRKGIYADCVPDA